jgi:hypothetical protein
VPRQHQSRIGSCPAFAWPCVGSAACRAPWRPDAADQSERYGAEMPVPEWRERLVCSKCGSRDIDMVVTGTEQRRV